MLHARWRLTDGLSPRKFLDKRADGRRGRMKSRSKRRATHLVQGHLERISSRAFDDYREVITKFIGRSHGVYALYKDDRLYYVGLASNLRGRIKGHLKDRHAQRWDRFSLYLVGNSDHLKELESLVLHIASPRGNIQAGKLPGSRHMVRELERLVREHERRQRERLLYGERSMRAGGKRPDRARSQRKRKAASRDSDKHIPLKGKLRPNQRLRAVYKGRTYSAWVRPSGRIYIKGKDLFETPSAAAVSVVKRPMNGWWLWHFRNKKGEWVRLKSLQK